MLPTSVKGPGYPCRRLFAIIRAVATEMVEVIASGGKVMVTCHAGRGRSGTVAALVVGILKGITSDSQMVQTIVTMR